METTNDHYYDCLVLRLREEIDLRREAMQKLILCITNDAPHNPVFNKAHRIDRELDEAIRKSVDKWIEEQFNRRQADKERR